MKQLMISERLKKITNYINKGATLADIGSDHAYLPCYAAINGIISKGIAGEINEGPFLSALDTVRTYELDHLIEVRRGDGLAVIKKGEVNTVVIAGMGGELIRHILDTGKDKLSDDMILILQPNVAERHLREWLMKEKWAINSEEILEEDGHIYEIIVASRSMAQQSLSIEDLWFGPYLRKQQTEPFKKKWNSEKHKRQNVLESLNKAKASEDIEGKKNKVSKEIMLIEEVLNE